MNFNIKPKTNQDLIEEYIEDYHIKYGFRCTIRYASEKLGVAITGLKDKRKKSKFDEI